MGTSRGYKMPTGGNWTPLKNDATDFVQGTASSDITPASLVTNFIRASGGLKGLLRGHGGGVPFIYAASEIGTEIPLLAPENGTIALNLPLTPSRSGSCSTRTMHPFYLNTLRLVLNDLGLKNTVINPLRIKTKGECVTGCLDQPFLSTLVTKAVSCSHGTRRQDWKRKKATNCGYCVPCLFRRSSLHAAQLDSGKEYGIDVCSDELTVDSERESADDLRALTSGLRHFDGDSRIRKAITSVARIEPVEEYLGLVRRGLAEVRSWITDKGSAKLRKAAGIIKNTHA